jgi:hypothetical protein
MAGICRGLGVLAAPGLPPEDTGAKSHMEDEPLARQALGRRVSPEEGLEQNPGPVGAGAGPEGGRQDEEVGHHQHSSQCNIESF